MKYLDRYEKWAGCPDGVRPNYIECAKAIPSLDSWPRVRQCFNKAKHDPDENGKPTTCGRHRGQKNRGEK